MAEPLEPNNMAPSLYGNAINNRNKGPDNGKETA